ncbi:MAG: 5-formyltetrahydrofolate cyclo-ligase [Zoogloea sp.]|nr:5-formyltetrahydrofolate cyclo-ligase [Zoogloea sp.]
MPPENSTVNTPNSPAGGDIAALRRRLRQAAIAAREALPAETRTELSARIESHLEALLETLVPRTLAFCWPWRGEVDLVAWVGRWLAADPLRQAALPEVTAPEQPMAFRRWQPGDAMDTDHHGIPVPAHGLRVTPDVILVPLNAFDAAGYRLGYGGGYFDRTLAALDPAPRCIGVAFELARTDSTHPQPHDQPMDWIVTEAGSFRARPGLSD